MDKISVVLYCITAVLWLAKSVFSRDIMDILIGVTWSLSAGLAVKRYIENEQNQED